MIFNKSIMYVILILYICRKLFNFKFLWFVQKRFVFFMHLYFVHNCCCPFSECALSCTTLFFFLSVRFRVQLCFFFLLSQCMLWVQLGSPTKFTLSPNFILLPVPYHHPVVYISHHALHWAHCLPYLSLTLTAAKSRSHLRSKSHSNSHQARQPNTASSEGPTTTSDSVTLFVSVSD